LTNVHRNPLDRMMITPATPTDAPAVIALWQACGLTRPWNDPQADFDLALAGSQSTVLIARECDVTSGSVMVGFDGHRGWVYYLAVAPEERRQGLGRALMEAAEAWLRVRGAPKIQLMVRAENVAAAGFYSALGFALQPVSTFGKRLDKSA
jgi:ribosomal protein S18 acetylase RimI-like enzyme